MHSLTWNSSPNTNTNVTIKLPLEALSQTEVQEQSPHFPRFENPKLVLTKIDTHKHTSPSHTSHAHTHTHYQICREAHQKLQNITCLVKHSMRCSVRFVKRWPWILKRPLGECNPPPSHRHTRTNTTHTTTSNSLHRSLPWEWVIWWQKKKRREDLTSDRETKNRRKKREEWRYGDVGVERHHLTLSREISSQQSGGRWLSTGGKDWDEQIAGEWGVFGD